MSPRGRGFGRGMGGGRGRGWGRSHRLRDGSCRGGSVLSPGNAERNAAAIKAASTVAVPLLKLAGQALLQATRGLLERARQRPEPDRIETTVRSSNRELDAQREPEQIEVVEVEALPVDEDNNHGRYLHATPRTSTRDSNSTE
ncbi:hypothetical protein KQI52_09405 [bacterium]|nr:hypothetical protein [bacterium]